MSFSKEHILQVVQQALEQPKVKYKLVANALPSQNGEYWTAILISTPADIQDCAVHDKYETPHNIHESGNEQNSQGILPVGVDEQYHSGFVYHSAGKDALTGLCHHLLLDAIFRLWSYSDSLSDNTSVTRNTYTVKG